MTDTPFDQVHELYLTGGGGGGALWCVSVRNVAHRSLVGQVKS